MAIKQDMNDPLIRKVWVKQALFENKHKSKLNGLIGKSASSVIHMSRLETAKNGHSITFDSGMSIEGVVVEDRDPAYGKGEEKRKIHSVLNVKRYRMPLYNGDMFDADEINARDLTTHAHSKKVLGEFYMKWRDQKVFDCLQGLSSNTRDYSRAEPPSHEIDLGEKGLTYEAFWDIQHAIETSDGFDSERAPLLPFSMANGEDMWLFMCDSYMIHTLRQDSRWQDIMSQGDNRGNDNRIISGVIGRIGQLLVMNVGVLRGKQLDGAQKNPLKTSQTKLNMSGLRQLDSNGLWTGEEGFDRKASLYSRGCVVGQNAIQMGYGQDPDFKWRENEDFGIDSSSMLQVIMDVQKTRYEGSNSPDNVSAKIQNLDLGVVNVKCKVKTA